MNWIDIDYAQCAYAAAKFLFQLGHQRVTIIDDESERMQLYLSGAMRAKAQFANGTHGSAIVSLEPLRSLSHVAQHERPTSYLCPNMRLGREILKSAAESQLVVGRDISVIAYDDGTIGPLEQDPALTVCRVSIDLLARRTLEALCRLIDTNAAYGGDPFVKTELVIGKTTGEPATR
ncbi:substrate-binding domain-containing protein [Rhizobium sp. R635]|uniref:substrate-binding domain-containing protein n=1 Tax=unclassified Rhizobium TaxID=2613769 RepID=UPI001FD986B1|nr:substrate-binding domain-containing protein [Rhizobium sp. R635]